MQTREEEKRRHKHGEKRKEDIHRWRVGGYISKAREGFAAVSNVHTSHREG